MAGTRPLPEPCDHRGRMALVTGGSRWLGLEMAEALGEAGARVAITARREQWLQPAAAHLRDREVGCLAVPSDITQPEQVERLVGEVLDRFTRMSEAVLARATWGFAWPSPIRPGPRVRPSGAPCTAQGADRADEHLRTVVRRRGR